ncbi:MAG TPA: alpha/beta hydrolase [Verrucomicrobiales bacterium]|nr:alpha/beta hydrolase [Verrucomicrobiales bacterium]
MPLLTSTYRAPWWLPGGHAQTLGPRLLRRAPPVNYRRERIATPDGDFLDLDWSKCGGARVVVILHGLEGCSRSRYVLGFVHALNGAGWDCVVLNFRGCGGELNRACRLYHSGETDDLHSVVGHVLAQSDVVEVALLGVSLGGNVLLKYLGEQGDGIDRHIGRAMALSVPCDLASSAAQLARPTNRLYMRYFLRSLARKAQGKAAQFPGRFSTEGLGRMVTFAEFDGQVTAPLHGFAGADDYWRQCSSRLFVPRIRLPTLLLSARNDPFLTPECFPEEEAKASTCFHLEAPTTGGHVGFSSARLGGPTWSERRAVEFLGGAMP